MAKYTFSDINARITGYENKLHKLKTNLLEGVAVTFGPGRVERRLHSSSRVLVNLQELDPGVSRDVLAAYLQVKSGQGSEGTVGSSVN